MSRNSIPRGTPDSAREFSESRSAAAAEDLFEFERFVGIPVANVAIRGVAGGGLPWSVQRAEAKLGTDGVLTVEVKGLVFAAGPNVGRNTVANFVATLSCLDGFGAVVNVQTAPFPATAAGDAKTAQVLAVPDPCLAPVVLVGAPPAPPTFPFGRWFAVGGF